tara:strand:- start:79 stop:273 length:195 start_codon:yes stop_codon:yes gene_type:complete
LIINQGALDMNKTLHQRLVAIQVAHATNLTRGIKPQHSFVNFLGTFLGALAIFAVGFIFWMVTP